MAYEVPITNVNLAQQALLPGDLAAQGFELGQKQLAAQRQTEEYNQQKSQQKALQDIFARTDTSTPEGQADLIRQVGRVSPQMGMELQAQFQKGALTQAQIGEHKAKTEEAVAKTGEIKEKSEIEKRTAMTGFLGDANQALQNISQIIPDKTILPGTTTYKERMERANKMVDEWSKDMKLKYPDQDIQGIIQRIDSHDWQTPDEFRNHLGMFQKLQAASKQQQPAVPSGYEPNPQGGLQPVKGGPADPTQIRRESEARREPIEQQAERAEAVAKARQDAKVTATLQGGRESVFNQRVMSAGLQASLDLGNVVELPMTVSTGIAGMGRHRTGIFDAAKEALATKVTPEDQQIYNVMATGFQRNIAAIEASGLANVQGLSKQMDTLILNPGDTNLTKLSKLAQIRQIVTGGMDTLLTNPRLAPEQKDLVRQVKESVEKSVPFTQKDIINLIRKQEDNPKATLRDAMGGKEEKKKEGGVLKYNPETGGFD